MIRDATRRRSCQRALFLAGLLIAMCCAAPAPCTAQDWLRLTNFDLSADHGYQRQQGFDGGARADYGDLWQQPADRNGTPLQDLFNGMQPEREQQIPDVPEPMVFDLVRQLGARKGELEVNVLAEVPLRRRISGPGVLPDSIGIIPEGNRPNVEWAPEIEYALWDGFALEFELPFEGTQLEAYKAAAQWTFGTAFNDKFIHGLQIITQYDIDSFITMPTLLYLFAFEIDDRWSVMAMLGGRTQITRHRLLAERSQTLANVTLFRKLTEDVVFGFETNLARATEGSATALLMPQLHVEFAEGWVLQFGAGAFFTHLYTLPQASFRLIREF